MQCFNVYFLRFYCQCWFVLTSVNKQVHGHVTDPSTRLYNFIALYCQESTVAVYVCFTIKDGLQRDYDQSQCSVEYRPIYVLYSHLPLHLPVLCWPSPFATGWGKAEVWGRSFYGAQPQKRPCLLWWTGSLTYGMRTENKIKGRKDHTCHRHHWESQTILFVMHHLVSAINFLRFHRPHLSRQYTSAHVVDFWSQGHRFDYCLQLLHINASWVCCLSWVG